MDVVVWNAQDTDREPSEDLAAVQVMLALGRVIVNTAIELVRWHWQKAGTIELVHDVTKNEIAAAVPPCGRFGANAAWYRLSLLTYNVLSAMKWLALPPSMETARPKRMRFSLFSIAGRILSHAGQLVLRIGRQAEALAGLIAARLRIAKVGLARITAATA